MFFRFVSWKWVLLIAVVWTVVVGRLDWELCHSLWQQAKTYGFTTGDGTILPRDAATPDVVRYSYRIPDGRVLDGRTVPYSGLMARRHSPENMAAKYAPGAAVAVYFDPHLPQLAVLEPGFDNVDLFLMMLMMQLNLAALALGADLVMRLALSLRFSSLHRVWKEESLDGAMRLHARRRYGLLWYPWAVLFVGPWIVLLVAALTPGAPPGVRAVVPGMGFMLLAWIIILLLAVAATWKMARQGGEEIVIDRARGTIGTKRRKNIALAEVTGLDVLKREHRDLVDWIVTLERNSREKVALTKCDVEEEAREVAAWIEKQIGLRAAARG